MRKSGALLPRGAGARITARKSGIVMSGRRGVEGRGRRTVGFADQDAEEIFIEMKKFAGGVRLSGDRALRVDFTP